MCLGAGHTTVTAGFEPQVRHFTQLYNSKVEEGNLVFLESISRKIATIGFILGYNCNRTT